MLLAASTGSVDDGAPLDLAASGDAVALGMLYDAYGPSLYRLARVVVGTAAGAELAVCEGFHLVRTRPVDAATGQDLWHELVRFTMLPSSTSTGDGGAGAATLGLTMFGDHTYREAAQLLDIETEVAADVLRTALHDVRRSRVEPGTTATVPIPPHPLDGHREPAHAQRPAESGGRVRRTP